MSSLINRCERGCDPMSPARRPLLELASMPIETNSGTEIHLPQKRQRVPFTVQHLPFLTLPKFRSGKSRIGTGLPAEALF